MMDGVIYRPNWTFLTERIFRALSFAVQSSPTNAVRMRRLAMPYIAALTAASLCYSQVFSPGAQQRAASFLSPPVVQSGRMPVCTAADLADPLSDCVPPQSGSFAGGSPATGYNTFGSDLDTDPYRKATPYQSS